MRYLRILRIPDTKAAIVLSAIEDIITRYTMQLKDCHGQGYDGASNFQGSVAGVAKFRKGEVHQLYLCTAWLTVVTWDSRIWSDSATQSEIHLICPQSWSNYSHIHPSGKCFSRPWKEVNYALQASNLSALPDGQWGQKLLKLCWKFMTPSMRLSIIQTSSNYVYSRKAGGHF